MGARGPTSSKAAPAGQGEPAVAGFARTFLTVRRAVGLALVLALSWAAGGASSKKPMPSSGGGGGSSSSSSSFPFPTILLETGNLSESAAKGDLARVLRAGARCGIGVAPLIGWSASSPSPTLPKDKILAFIDEAIGSHTHIA